MKLISRITKSFTDYEIRTEGNRATSVVFIKGHSYKSIKKKTFSGDEYFTITVFHGDIPFKFYHHTTKELVNNYIYDYFYTPEEARDLQINNILDELNM